MSIQVKIKNQAETQTKITLDKDTPHIQLQTSGKYVSENIAIELEGADQSDASSTANDILLGKTAYVGSGKITGTMSNNGIISETIVAQGGTATIPAGYTSGGTVTANIPATILDNTIISGTAYEESTGDYAWKSTVNVPAGYHNAQTIEKTFSDVFPAPATEGTSADLRLGKLLYNHEGKLLTGTITEKSEATYTASTSDLTISANLYLTGVLTIKAVALNATASNMLSGTSATITSNGSTIATVSGTISTYANAYTEKDRPGPAGDYVTGEQLTAMGFKWEVAE